MEHGINTLLIEDSPTDSFLFQNTLGSEACGMPVHIDVASTLAGGVERLSKNDIDIIFLDLSLPDSSGLYGLRTLTHAAPQVPIVILTGLDDEKSAVTAVAEGAQDYLVKRSFNRTLLTRVIRYALERHRIRVQLDHSNAELRRLALVDPLTELLNRRGIQEELSTLKSRVNSADGDLHALLIDLDDFKRINDSLGHAVGDVVLKIVAERIGLQVRRMDRCARIGGDEFLVLLPQTRFAEGLRVAEKIRLAVSHEPIVLASGKSLTVSASLGLVAIASNVSSIDEVLNEMHVALSTSKRTGKDRVSASGSSSRRTHRPVLKDLQKKLQDTDTFRAFRHAIYSLDTAKPIGYEFLSRSRITNFEMPEDFFRMGMESNILTLIDNRCFRACIEASKSVERSLRCHVNIFPSTMIGTPVEHLLQALKGRDRGSYCLEISEQQIIGDPSYLVATIEQIKKAGVLIGIDDVGFGRSCLESLILLEPHIIKIDKRCVIGLAGDPARKRSLKRILNVARSLETEVVAEGIENEKDLEAIRDLGVMLGQGFYWDEPRP